MSLAKRYTIYLEVKDKDGRRFAHEWETTHIGHLGTGAASLWMQLKTSLEASFPTLHLRDLAFSQNRRLDEQGS